MLEVPITHPTAPGDRALGLQWCAVPAIANFRMEIGGIDYGCLPFNGWFMGTEIARNLWEEKRYDRAEAIAAALGLDTSTESDALARPGVPRAQRRDHPFLPAGAGDAGRPPDRRAAVHDPRPAREEGRPRMPGAMVLDRAGGGRLDHAGLAPRDARFPPAPLLRLRRRSLGGDGARHRAGADPGAAAAQDRAGR